MIPSPAATLSGYTGIFPVIDTTLTMQVLLGMLGLVAARTREKEKDRAQREMEQTRKMVALGQITGSLAHDFNNILGVIMGYMRKSRLTSPKS